MFAKNASRALAALACAFALAACGNDNASESPKIPAGQAEIQKYNAYVGAANSAGQTYERALDNWERYLKPKLSGKEALKDLSISDGTPYTADNVKEQLDKALGMDLAMAELDGPARAFSDAIAKFQPISADMNNYISAKTYMSDKGAHGKEIMAAYEETLKGVVSAQAAFFGGIDAKDRARVKAEFENAKKDTAAYYRAGLIYYGKQSFDQAEGLFDGTGLGDQLEPFGKSLDEMNKMALGYDAKMRESNPKGCPSLMLQVNSYLSTGRTAIEHTTSGRYAEDAKRTGAFKMIRPTIDMDSSSLRQNYNNMISRLNMNQC
ncbi:hypothetical protein CEG14_19160 [Bordetella genomosp. 1]|uniref:DUF3829 domain-containing protein n=1 Tax=Bordetella genomosp. 1 TaxID=1395607 RepID=A0A261S6H7_9BORD|nr:DUF3829 domain-containing protein [Bordetella genomosp. 1]OZI32984.1 hypothetical protein CEG14_19160 [Bordetella genomosp. 1]OZI57089.1 hypothetical protein CAL27_22835 [Bordetella genomosp. 1]